MRASCTTRRGRPLAAACLLPACTCRSAHARAPHTLPTTCAVCSTLRKPAPRRLAAAEPAAPPAPSLPPPAGEAQPPNQQGPAPQAAPAAKKKWWDFDLALRQAKLLALGVSLLAAAKAFQLGVPRSAVRHLFMAVLILVTPWVELKCVGGWAACVDGGWAAYVDGVLAVCEMAGGQRADGG